MRAAILDRVVVTEWVNDEPRELDGWLIRRVEQPWGTFVTIAASPDDDGRDDPESDWWRATFRLDNKTRISAYGGKQ